MTYARELSEIAAAVTVDSSKNIGIGTTTPSSKLTVSGSNVTVSAGYGIAYSADQTRIFTPEDNVSGGLLQWGAGAILRFNAGSSTERMRIDSSGNCGIGTSSPAYKLQVNGTITSSTASGTAPTLLLNQSGIGAGQIRVPTSVNALAFDYFNGSVLTEAMRIDGSGNLLVGATSAFGIGPLQVQAGTSRQLSLRHSSATAGKYWGIGPDNGANNLVIFNQSGQGVFMPDGATSWSGTSDERLKEDLLPISDAANKVSTLRAVTGRYKTDEKGTSRSFLIAQDVQKVLPEAVNVQDDEIGTLGLSYTDVIPLLVAAIKEQQAMIEELKAKVAALEAA